MSEQTVSNHVRGRECRQLRESYKRLESYAEVAKRSPRSYQVVRYHIAGECSHEPGKETTSSKNTKYRQSANTEPLARESADEIIEQLEKLPGTNWTQRINFGLEQAAACVRIDHGYRDELADIVDQYKARVHRERDNGDDMWFEIRSRPGSPHQWSEDTRQFRYWKRRYFEVEHSQFTYAMEKASRFAAWLAAQDSQR